MVKKLDAIKIYEIAESGNTDGGTGIFKNNQTLSPIRCLKHQMDYLNQSLVFIFGCSHFDYHFFLRQRIFFPVRPDGILTIPELYLSIRSTAASLRLLSKRFY